MRSQSLLLSLLLSSAPLWAQSPSTRPAITGISHLAVYASDAAAAEHFYVHDLGAAKGADPESAAGARYYFSPTQFVEVLPLPANAGINRLDHTAYNTPDADGLRRYMGAHGVTVPAAVEKGTDGSRWFAVKDPEGNKVEFVQPGHPSIKQTAEGPISKRIIHVGFLVHSRDAEDGFYKKVLGFKPYWYGGMKEGHTDWISQQTPDGHDWLEYMMTDAPKDGSGMQAVSQSQLGVMDHFSLGVEKMDNSVKLLQAGNRVSAKHSGPQIGKDGKWQYNLFDPDGTRVELMEFGNVQPPCCSQFTAENPKD